MVNGAVEYFLQNWRGLAWLGGAAVSGLLLNFIIFKVLQFFTRGSRSVLSVSWVKHGRGPSRLIIPVLFIRFVMPFIPPLSTKTTAFINHFFEILLICAIGWLCIKVVSILEEVILSRYKMEDADNLHARKIYTQIRILKKVVIIVVGLLALAAILITFQKIRLLGTSILASAGIAGIIVGFAAQKSLATLLAGVQIAITQPIRIDDVVIVENDWGRIEEITLTYVVIRIWDLRRLIVPITYFLEKPFENWTRVSADLIGSVFLYVDYTVPVEEVRTELQRILEKSEKWDGRVSALQVTNATDKSMELRALVSAKDSSKAWDLRCYVREKLIAFLQKNHPHGLPRVRAEIRDGKGEGKETESPRDE
jgi:small-conductance mechanosensitive channel